ncbi:hypothetical protein [Sphingomonas sp. LHG3406-1]|uniref:hypothetical protein n=1 Tax=Sphingomonas sp. LHG3406-1 TaxID=2804617 RepID=UPI002615FFC6|nr:hypothetical protein [Sphingomonas sp. LHG3406-1]
MRKPGSVESLEQLGRVRLSKSFFMRDFLYSEIANFYGIPNIPDNPDLAIETGRKLCETILEPLQERFGRISIRSAYRSPAVNSKGIGRHNCASNDSNYAGHIWDYRDADGSSGATACVVVNSFVPYYERTGHWEALAWWLHDELNVGSTFYPKLAAFNASWYEGPRSGIYSYIPPRKGNLTRAGDANWSGTHAHEYAAMLAEVDAAGR